ncbi:MAG: S26 family signal peptidase [Acidimicrobiia bacterium]
MSGILQERVRGLRAYRPRRLVRHVLFAALIVCAAVASALRRFERVEVVGPSMHPTLGEGDRLVIRRTEKVTAGDLVAFTDAGRIVVKRVHRRHGDRLFVIGDNLDNSIDSRHFGLISVQMLRGRVVYRYHPPARVGPVR